MPEGRLWAIREVTARSIRSLPELNGGAGVLDVFGVNTFNAETMRQKLPKSVYHSLLETVRRGERLEPSIANEVAHAVKEWALSKGATHFCHWFQPQTGLTAEKHDAFLTFDEQRLADGALQRRAAHPERAGRLELPVGRHAHHVRGARLHGLGPVEPDLHRGRPEREDAVRAVGLHQLPRRRARQEDAAAALDGVLSERALELLRAARRHGRHARGADAGARAGVLPDRPRVLRAAPRPGGCRPHARRRASRRKGQQLEDHYFGSIPDRIQAFMQESRARAVQARRPDQDAAQRGRAEPVRDGADLRGGEHRLRPQPDRHGDACGRVALRHNLACLLHEKPFAGINGSGKHCNWSLHRDSRGRATCWSRARRRTRTCGSSSSWWPC